MAPEERSPISHSALFEDLVLPHVGDLYRAAVRLVGPGHDAEDVLQETCLRAFRALHQLTNPGAARAWTFTILRSVFLHSLAQQLPLVRLEDVDDAPLEQAMSRWEEVAEASPLRHAMLLEVRRATLELPPAYREALVLAHVGGFSYREMAGILDVPTGTVMSRLFRARQLLRKMFEERAIDPSSSEAPR